MNLKTASTLLLVSVFTGAMLCSCSHEKAEDPIAVNATSQDSTRTPIKTDSHVVSMSRESDKLAAIRYEEATHHRLGLKVRTTGEVLANSNLQTHVTTPVTGRVTEVLVSIGDHIAEGKTLLKIRSTDIEQAEADLLQNAAQVKADLKRDLLQIDSDLDTAKAQIRLSMSTYKRMESLVNEKIASQADYETAKTGYEKDKITIESLQRKRIATIALSEERLHLLMEPTLLKLHMLGVNDADVQKVLKTHEIDPMVPIEAPEPGVISERLVNVGELVDPSKPLFTIGDFHNVWIKADIYEKDVAKVHVGEPIELELDSFPGQKFIGKLDFVADSLSPDTRTLTVRADVPNPKNMLKPKMFARMTILVGDQQVLAIPKSAIQDAGTQKVVYVPIGNDQFLEKPVKLGGDAGDLVEVLDGLTAGEKVVTNGSFDLRSKALREAGGI